jgi:hypothetical protein
MDRRQLPPPDTPQAVAQALIADAEGALRIMGRMVAQRMRARGLLTLVGFVVGIANAVLFLLNIRTWSERGDAMALVLACLTAFAAAASLRIVVEEVSQWLGAALIAWRVVRWLREMRAIFGKGE